MSERCETDKTPQAKANATDKFNSIARHNQRHCLFDNAATTNQAIFSAIFNSLLGLVIFFDDIANTLLIGKTMRPVTDKLRISREKLAYLVDSTAAPVAGIAFASTWVGFEVSVIGSTIEGVCDLDASPYLIFLGSVPYSFYPIIAVFMVLPSHTQPVTLGQCMTRKLPLEEQS